MKEIQESMQSNSILYITLLIIIVIVLVIALVVLLFKKKSTIIVQKYKVDANGKIKTSKKK